MAPQVDPSPPKWASSIKYSSLPTFLEGSWRYQIDDSTSRSHMHLPPALLELVTRDITFSADNRFTPTAAGRHANGTWRNVGGDVELDVKDVDGESPETVEANFQRWLKTPKGHTRYWDGRWQDYDFALSSAKYAHRLVLRPDRRTLGLSGEMPREDGTTFMGTGYYARLR